MSPAPQSDNWTLSGLASSSGKLGKTDAKPFTATLRMLCRDYWDESCWRLEQLEFPGSQDSARTLSKDLGLSTEDLKKQRILAAQMQLKAQGFDPGPLDGVMGLQTERALKTYLAKEAATTSGETSEAILAQLAAKGDRQLLESHYRLGNVHAAMQASLRVAEVDAGDGSGYYYRGRIYRGMGLGELAVEAQSNALIRNPSDAEALIDRGHAQYQLGHYWAALRDYRDGLGIRIIGNRYLTMKEGLAGGADATSREPEPLINRPPAALDAELGSASVAPFGTDSGSEEVKTLQENGPQLQEGNIHGAN